MPKIHSFDVYDTLLTRPFMRPVDLFHEVARTLGLDRTEWGNYALARVRAEHAARRAQPLRDDIRFPDIFRHFPELSAWRVEPAAAMTAELAAERRYTRGIAATIAEANEATALGKRVVFLSDMYLPGDFVWERLREAGVRCERSAVYVSSDVGLAKYSGSLFELMLTQERVKPAEVEHVGDNARSDVRVPSRMGIRSRRFGAIQPNRYERRIARSSAIDPLQPSRIAGASRVQRLSGALDATQDPTTARLAANVVAPFLTAFVTWVLEDASRRGIERLYFVSRDGQIFYKIAQALLRGRSGPECRYLYGSRQAWLLPSVLDPTHAQIGWAYPRGMSRRGRDILRRLDVDDDVARAMVARAGFDAPQLEQQLEGEAFERFKALLVSEPLAAHIRERAAGARDRAVAYLRQEGLMDGTSWALVDIGWALTCQRALRTVLRSTGWDGTVQGYYLGVERRHEPIAASGPARPFVTPGPDVLRRAFDLPGPLAAEWFFRLNIIVLMEHLFTMADHPTAKGYERAASGWRPTFREETRDADVLAFADRMQKAVVAYVEQLVEDALVDPASELYRRAALQSVADFALLPEAADVTGVAWLPTNKEQSHAREHVSRLASPLSLSDLGALILHEVAAPDHRSFHSPDFLWLAGSAAISPAPVRWLYHAALAVNRGRRRGQEWLRALLHRPDAQAARLPLSK